MFVVHFPDMPIAEMNHFPCPIPFKGKLQHIPHIHMQLLYFCNKFFITNLVSDLGLAYLAWNFQT